MSGQGEYHPQRAHLIICETVLAECASLIPRELTMETVPFARHSDPEGLRRNLQERIDMVPADKEFVLLGFALCSNAVAGLRSERQTIVVPRVHDCIALFCGSQRWYNRYAAAKPGTFFLTRRFIESEKGEYHLLEYDQYRKRYGARGAKRMIGLLLENYRSAALLTTGEYASGRYRRIGRRFARRYGLEYTEIRGNRRLVERLVGGNWNNDFIQTGPGEVICLEQFLTSAGEP